MNLVETLKAAIEDFCRRGGNPRQLAQKSGVPHPTIYRFLSGQRGMGIESAARLSEALGLRLVKARGKKKDKQA